jgi:O-methyltransferase
MSMPSARLVRLSGITPDSGHAYTCLLPGDLPAGDSMDDPVRSLLDLLEDGRSLGPPHSAHADIAARGGGRHSHWHGQLYFSASDNSDPRRNGRTYHAYVPAVAPDPRQARLEALVRQAREIRGREQAYALAEALFYAAYPDGFIGEFGKACWEAREFVADYERLVPGNRRSFERKFVVAEFVKSVRSVHGDMVECGVYNGATAYFMAQATAGIGVPRALHLFDSFQGLSAPTAVDGDYWQAGSLAISEEAARAVLSASEGVVFHRGWIPDRFPEVADRQFAFVHLDVDLYQPTLDSLAFFYPRTAPGGVLICDDYGFTTCPGATRAVDAFMQSRPETVIHLPTGQGVIIRG